MSTPVEQSKLARQTYRFAEQDGLTEIFAGVMLLTMGAVSGTRVGTGLVIFVLLFGAPALFRLRSRISYPRIGYAKLPPEPPTKLAAGILGFKAAVIVLTAIMMAIFGDVSDTDSWYRWSPAFVSLILIGMFNFVASKTGSRRYYVFAGLSVAAGLALALIPFASRTTGLVIYCSAMGVMFLLGGIMKFITFLRKYPKPVEEPVDGRK